MLYYPIPILMHVSARKPQLQQRLQLGLERFVATGEADALMNKTFQHWLNGPDQPNTRLLLMDNPIFDKDQNLAITQDFLAQYARAFTLIKHN